MDEKTKLYVFSKYEVALIFLFMLVTAITSFVVGVKIGKSYTYIEAGITKEDHETINILSGQEEKVNEVVNKMSDEENKKDLSMTELNQRLEEKIVDDLKGKKREKIIIEPPKPVIEQKKKILDKPELASPVKVEIQTTENKKNMAPDGLSGKYTIQLGSYSSLKDAEEFAEGFRVRGYSPFINEIELPNRGIWYRVTLGAFETVADAKSYVKKEDSLFQGQDYLFVRFE